MSILLKNATLVATMDAQRRELKNGAVYIKGAAIAWLGASDEIPIGLQDKAHETIDCTGLVLMPGMVNTHHHFYQTLTRAVPAAQNAELFDWLVTLYPIWSRLTPEMVYLSTQVALAELMLSGCTTSSDHHYLWPAGCSLDTQFEAASSLGMRFHGLRGAMSVGQSAGGLPPDSVVEQEAFILRDMQRLVDRYHDAKPLAMQRVALAPCSPFSVSADLMRESANLARSYQEAKRQGAAVKLHTHLAETLDEERYCIEKFGARPVDYAEQLGWLGDDVWHAHCVHLNTSEVNRFAQSGTGVAHCPSSNMRLASGIAPIRQMRDAGVAVSIAVDGSASNDSSHFLAEVRQAMLLARLGSKTGGKARDMAAREALEIATLGGAKVLGRDDIASLGVGKAADIVAFDTRTLGMSGGAAHDPLAALLFCQPQDVTHSIINGQLRVKNGEIIGLDLPRLIAQHNAAAQALLQS